jgi:ATP-binding cassette subfamily B protein
VLVVTHRLSVAVLADQILFLDGGRIVEQGTHAALLARPDGTYRRYWELQLHGGRGQVVPAAG